MSVGERESTRIIVIFRRNVNPTGTLHCHGKTTVVYAVRMLIQQNPQFARRRIDDRTKLSISEPRPVPCSVSVIRPGKPRSIDGGLAIEFSAHGLVHGEASNPRE